VAGASFIGTPSFPAGHNNISAWGVTNGLVDNTDLFIEEISPDGSSVREGSEFVPCEVRHETIHIKGADPVIEDVLITSRGPIIGPALDGEVGAISLSATWLALRPMKGLFQVHRAQSFNEFRRYFQQWPAVSLNMVYADTSGRVGWQLVGEVPKRLKGWGTIPLAGWDQETGWEEDPIPFDEMPYLADPEIGFMASANTKPTPERHGPFLGVDWVDGYRLARILEVLKSRQNWDLPGVQALQMDQKSLPWLELREIFLALPASSDEVHQVLEMMKGWNGLLEADSVEAAIFQLFVSEMAQRIVKAKAPNAAQWVLGKGFTALVAYTTFLAQRVGHLVKLVREKPQGWFEHSWDQEMADALEAVIRTLRQKHGANPRQWGWGRIRPLTLRHPVGEKAPFDRIFNLGPFAWGGDTNTVSQASTDLNHPSANPFIIASFRMVVDVGNWDESRYSSPGGQSGNPLSPHYSDLLHFWKHGDGVPIYWSAEKVEQAIQSNLRLEPV
jgi:penicillin amidase